MLRRYIDDHAEEAFVELVRRHLDLVYSTALRRLAGDAHLAKDVTQSVFTALARKAPSLTDRATLAGWLYLGAHHAAAQAVRSASRRRAHEQEAHVMHELLSPSTPASDWERVRLVLDEAMRELTDSDREVVLLRFFERRPFAEIGRVFAVSDAAARMRVERALEKLRALLARRGVTSTSAALSVALASQTVVAAPAGLAATVIGGAFASAGGVGASGALAAAIFMNTKTTLVMAIAVLAIGFSIYEFDAPRREREAVAGLQAQLRAAQQRSDEAVRQNAALQRELAAARVAKAAPAPAPVASAAAPETRKVEGAGGFFLGSMTREEARRRNLQSLDTNYATFYRDLNLTPEQREQFKNLMLDIQEANQRLFAKAVAEARASNRKFDRADQFEVFEALNAQTEAEQQAAVREALGEPAAHALQAYQATGPMRMVVKQLAANLFNSEASLFPAQAEQLIEIMARNSRGPTGKVEMVALNIETALAQAASLLSPVQLAELRKAAEIAVEQAKRERAFNTAPAASLK